MIKRLAASPSSQVTSCQGYDINGYLLYNATMNKKTVSQNSGARIEALDERTRKVQYILVSQMIYGKCTMVPIYKSQSFGVVGSNTQKVLRQTAIGSRLSTSTILVIKMTHGYLLHSSHRYSTQLILQRRQNTLSSLENKISQELRVSTMWKNIISMMR